MSQDTQVFSSYLTSKIAEFDFERLYTKTNRMLLHVCMWFTFSVLLLLSYILAYKLSLFNAVILTIRMTTVNMLVFYLFFYVLLSKILAGGRNKIIVLLIISLPFLLFIWIAITYFFSHLYHALGFEIENGELKGAIKMSADQTFLQAVSFKRMISQAFIVISILSPFFFVKILFEISKLYSKTLKIQQEKASLEIENIHIEKNFLKAQLNPHFLFNTLNNLYGLAIKKDPATPDVIVNLSDIMSYTLYESNTEKVSLQKELEFIKNYSELEKMRYPADKKIVLQIPDENNLMGLYIAPLLTFTFIENAFKYGLSHNKEQFIYLSIKIEDNQFYFHLENDVDDHVSKKEFGGIGIANVQKRLQLLYPDKHELRIENLQHKFVVSLKINLTTHG